MTQAEDGEYGERDQQRQADEAPASKFLIRACIAGAAAGECVREREYTEGREQHQCRADQFVQGKARQLREPP